MHALLYLLVIRNKRPNNVFSLFKLSPTAFLDQADIQILSFFFSNLVQLSIIAVRFYLSFSISSARLHSLSPWHPNIASGSIPAWEHSRAVWLICSEGRETELMNLLLDFWNSRLPRLDRLTDCRSESLCRMGICPRCFLGQSCQRKGPKTDQLY